MHISRTARTRSAALLIHFVITLGVLLAACGGGGDAGTNPAVVDNSVGRVDIAPPGTSSLASGASLTLTASAFTKDSRPLASAAIAWASSNEASITVSGGVITARLVGTATITASSGGVTSAGITLSVVPGAAASLAIKTQPSGAAAGEALTAQPSVEVRDQVGNLVSASVPVTVSIASGGGTLTGVTTVDAVAGVAAFSGLTIGGVVGPRTLSFASAGVPAALSASFGLAPGQPTQLVVRTQPMANTAYVPLLVPPTVELRDAFGNLTSSTALVTATIASGGGTLSGAAVNAVGGVATFPSLTVLGVAGQRSLAFGSGVLTATSALFNVAAAPPAVIGGAKAASMYAIIGTSPITTLVQITNTGVFPLTNLRVQSITYSPAAPGGWLSANFPSGTDAPSSLRLSVTSNTLPIGTYLATVTLAGDGASATSSLTVTTVVLAPIVNAFGTNANKVSVLPISSTLTPGVVTTLGSGAVTTQDPTVTYVARSPEIASVDATGRVTGVSQGQAWVAATSQLTGSDSVFVIVPNRNGPILRTDITKYGYRVGDTISVRLQLDTRGTAICIVTATLSWPVYIGTGVFGSMTFVDVAAGGSPLAPIFAVDQSVNVIRVSGANLPGVSGIVTLGVARFVVRTKGVTGFYTNATELIGPDLQNLLLSMTFTQYPIIVP